MCAFERNEKGMDFIMSKYKIGTVEAIMLVLTILTPYAVISLPRTLINELKSGIVLNIVFVTILVIFITLFICKIFKNFPGFDLLDIANYLGGNWFKNIIGTIFIIYFLVSSAILLRNFAEGLRVIYYPQTNIIFIELLFIIALFFVNSLGLNATIRTSTLILPAVLVSILLLFVGNFQNFTAGRFYPIFGNGFQDTFILGLTNIGTFGVIGYIYFLPPFLKEPEKFKKISIISVVIAGLFLLLCIITLLFMFSFYISTDQIMPLFSASRYIEFGDFFQRFESIFLLIWIMAFCCYLSVACKFSTILFRRICKIKESPQLTYIFSLIIFAISLIPGNYSDSNFYETHIYRYLRLIIVFGLGISILVLANLKKKKVGDSNKANNH